MKYIQLPAGRTVHLDSYHGKESVLFENMKPGVIVYVKIRAVASEGAGEESDVAAIAPVPSKVAGVKAVKAAKDFRDP